ncbi:MAG TPA: hypothetical protein VLW50_18300 [Streptosporangiaceae bacterium]|nr:hypothetical protein [Streptosporangiaceae bacterium]
MAGPQPGGVHLNISSPGWANHAWSNVYAPWIAVARLGEPRLEQRLRALDRRGHRAGRRPPAVFRGAAEAMVRCGVTTFCAPPAGRCGLRLAAMGMVRV